MEVVWFSSKFKKAAGQDSATDVQIGTTVISPSEQVRDLEVMLQSDGMLGSENSCVCSAASYGLWPMGRIRKFMDQPTAENLVHAFVTSRLDSCNSLYHGLPENALKKLQ